MKAPLRKGACHHMRRAPFLTKRLDRASEGPSIPLNGTIRHAQHLSITRGSLLDTARTFRANTYMQLGATPSNHSVDELLASINSI
eukprot:5151064-Pleurochrysis_carterae.AAC.1